MGLKLAIWALFAVSMICVLPHAAAAEGPYFAGGGFAPWAYWPGSVYAIERRPYFALHPPVYYSYPVARTYGLLPYPYLPSPVIRDVRRPVPQRIVNPYVVESGVVGGPPQTALPERVHVTYPAAMFAESK